MNTDVKSWVGRRLAGGRYRVTAKLGEGGMGCVFKAHDANLDCDVVIKVPRPSLLDDPEFAGRFAREIHSLVRLVHPHIVRITDVGEHDRVPFAVMQCLPGGSLHDRQRGQAGRPTPLPPGTLAEWLEPVAEALDYIHKQGYVHRDIKPANILFDADGSAYVSDFGVAKAVSGRTTGHAESLTGTGMVLGTAEYMAPEMLLGEDYDGHVDQYALAVTVYEVLTGQVPFTGPTPGAILIRQTTEEARPLQELVPSVPAEVSAAVARALAKKPGDRFAGCLEFARAVLRGLPAGPRRGASLRMPATGAMARAAAEHRVSCPKCGKGYTVPARALTKRMRCPACQEVFYPSQEPAAPGKTTSSAATGRQPQAQIDTKAVGVGRGRTRGLPPPPPPGADERPDLPEPAEAGGGSRGRRSTWVWGGVTAVLAATLVGVLVWSRMAAAPQTPAPPTGQARATTPADQASVALGRQLYRQHEYDKAIEKYNEAIRLNPRSAEAYAFRGEVYLAKRDPEKAHQDSDQAIAIDNRLAVAYAFRGKASVDLGDFEAGFKDFETALQLDKNLALGYTYRGVARALKEQYDPALDDGNKAVTLEPKLAFFYTNRSFIRHLRGEEDQAIADCTQAITLDPRDAVPFLNRGLAHFARKDYDLAVKDFSTAFTLDRTWAAAVTNRGHAYLATRKYDDALADFTQVIALDPKDAAAYKDRGVAYLRKGAFEPAVQDFTSAIERNPNYAVAYYHRGEAHAALGQLEPALDDYTQALARNPNDTASLLNRGVVYGQLKKPDLALADFTRLLEIDPKHAVAHNNRGSIYAGLGQFQKAIDDFSEAIRLDPDYALAWYHRGTAYASLGQFDRAIADCDKAIDLNPKDPAAYINRGFVSFQRGEAARKNKDLSAATAAYDDAIRHYDRAIDLAPKLDPNLPTAYFNRGSAHLGKQEFDLAIADFDSCIGLNPNYAPAYLFRGIAYAAKGDPARAAADRARAAQIDPNLPKP
jgi:tetratricopeptide (TPR) repeat protein